MTVDQARSLLSSHMTAQAEHQIEQIKAKQKTARKQLANQNAKLPAEQRSAKETLKTAQEARTAREELEGPLCLRKGVGGL